MKKFMWIGVVCVIALTVLCLVLPTHAEEFAEYNAFVEQVKAEVNKEAAEQIERYSKSLGNTEGE